MAVAVSITDSSGAYTIVGQYLNGISNLTFAATGITYNYGVFVLDDQRLCVTAPTSGAISFALGVISLAAGTHTLVLQGWGQVVGITKTNLATLSFTVKAYTAPSITSFTAQRCLSDGTVKSSGTYVKYTLIAAIDPVTISGVNKNAPVIKLRYRVSGVSTWTDIPLTTSAFSWNASTLVLATPTLPVGTTYDFGAYVADRWKTASAQTVLPRYSKAFNVQWLQNALSVCIGSLADEVGKFKVVLPSKFTDTVEFGVAPSFEDAAGSKSALGIQSGSVSTTLPNNSTKTGTVTFARAYATAPTVIPALKYSGSATSTVIKLFIASSTATDFTWYLSSSGSGTTAVEIWWIAVGVPA